eukprot:jgi/Hompol1/5338/HPOL_001233-RA
MTAGYAAASSVLAGVPETLLGLGLNNALRELEEFSKTQPETKVSPLSRSRREFISTIIRASLSVSLDGHNDGLKGEMTFVEFRKKLSSINIETTGNIGPVIDTVYDILDLSIEASHQGFADKTITLRLVQDLLDTVIVDIFEHLYEYLNSRMPLLKEPISTTQANNLLFLRFCNEYVRRVSKSNHSALRGKMLTLLSNTFSLCDKSGINMRGDFDSENVTITEVAPPAGDSEMEVDLPTGHMEIYEDFWSIQAFFTDAKLLLVPENLKKFELTADKFLAISRQLKGDSAKSTDSESGSQRRSSTDRSSDRAPVPKAADKGFFAPKFLTSKSLFLLEIICQFLVMVQFLLSLTKTEIDEAIRLQTAHGHNLNRNLILEPKFEGENEASLRSLRRRLLDTLEDLSPNRREFAKLFRIIMLHERSWMQWKTEMCFEYSRPPEISTEVPATRRLDPSQVVKGFSLGTPQLTKLWQAGSDIKQVLRDKAKRLRDQDVHQQLTDLDWQIESDFQSLAEGVDDESDLHCNNEHHNWLAYRIATKSRLDILFDWEKPPKPKDTKNTASRQPALAGTKRFSEADDDIIDQDKITKRSRTLWQPPVPSREMPVKNSKDMTLRLLKKLRECKAEKLAAELTVAQEPAAAIRTGMDIDGDGNGNGNSNGDE